MVEKMQMLGVTAILFAVAVSMTDAGVVELNEKFGDHYKQGKWLVMFYAPWCGHCKKLAPVYHDVANALKNAEIIVGKMDATRFSMIASEFEVRGYPTIKFFTDGSIHTFHGERSREDIVEFVMKAKGPPVRPLASVGRFNEVKNVHSDSVFFMYVGDTDPDNDLYKKYSSVAKDQVALSYFYSVTKSVVPETISLKSYPTILVFKDKDVYEYEAPRGIATMSSIEHWIKGEKFTAYPLISGGNINQLADTGKLLVIFIIHEIEAENKALNERIKNVGRQMAVDERSTYHSAFQFLWMDDPETANNIMLTFITLPYVMVLDPTLHVFYVPETDISKLDTATLGKFLEEVKTGKLPPLGGTGFFQRLKRVFYELLVTIISVWESSTWLFLIMFGLPTAVISIVCYSLCCMDTIDEQIHSDDEDSDSEDEYRKYVLEQQEHKQMEMEASEEQNQDHPKSE